MMYKFDGSHTIIINTDKLKTICLDKDSECVQIILSNDKIVKTWYPSHSKAEQALDNFMSAISTYKEEL